MAGPIWVILILKYLLEFRDEIWKNCKENAVKDTLIFPNRLFLPINH